MVAVKLYVMLSLDGKTDPKSKFDLTFVVIKGGFPLSRNFYVRTDVTFKWLYVRKLK